MLAIVAAFKEEIKDYLKQGRFRAVERQGSLCFYSSGQLPDVVVVEGAFGKERAQDAAREVIERYRPQAIVSPGFAGGAQPDLEPGNLFICESVMCMEGPAVFWRSEAASEIPVEGAALSWIESDSTRANGQFSTGKCMSLPQLVSSRSMKQWIGSTFAVDVIDMESYWISRAAAERGIPCLVVRAVMDPMEQALPEFVGDALNDQGGQRARRAVRYAASNPLQVPTLLRLAGQSRAARSSLSEFLMRLTPHNAPALHFAVDTG